MKRFIAAISFALLILVSANSLALTIDGYGAVYEKETHKRIEISPVDGSGYDCKTMEELAKQLEKECASGVDLKNVVIDVDYDWNHLTLQGDYQDDCYLYISIFVSFD